MGYLLSVDKLESQGFGVIGDGGKHKKIFDEKDTLIGKDGNVIYRPKDDEVSKAACLANVKYCCKSKSYFRKVEHGLSQILKGKDVDIKIGPLIIYFSKNRNLVRALKLSYAEKLKAYQEAIKLAKKTSMDSEDIFNYKE